MERKIHDFFAQEIMPEACARRIENRMTHSPKPFMQWRRIATVAAALVLVLALFNAEAISATADSLWNEIAHALKPEVAQELDKDVGNIGADKYNGYGGLTYTQGDHDSSVSWDCVSTFVEVVDGRLIFSGNGEYIDITDLCSEDKAYVYPLSSGNGTIHYLCVGGTADDYGYAELIFDYNKPDTPFVTAYTCNSFLTFDDEHVLRNWYSSLLISLGLDYLT